MKYLIYGLLMCLFISKNNYVLAQITSVSGNVKKHSELDFLFAAEEEAKNPPIILKKIGNGSNYFQMKDKSVLNAEVKYTKTAQQNINKDNAETPNSPAPATTFQGLDDAGTSIPPDVNGAVGLNYVMVTLNTQVRIQTKTGTTLSTVSLDGFWSGLGNPFDPKILYDHLANRWIFITVANSKSANSALLVAVSKTNDPTGSWDRYSIDVDASNVDWFDFPCVGFNKDWIVVTGNMFAVSNDVFKNTQTYVFNKHNLYNGISATFTLVSGEGFTIAPAVMYDNQIDKIYMLENWNSGAGVLRLTEISGPLNSPAFRVVGFLGVNGQVWSNSAGLNLGPQKDSDKGIHTNDARISNVVFQNGSLWATHHITLSNPLRTAVQWWQINPSDQTVTQFGRIDDVSGKNWYVFPSIAVNSVNDVLIGYTSLSEEQYPSANYAIRYADDALNTLQADYIYKAGLSPYFKTFSTSTTARNRWGDYSSASVDPVNGLDMWTLQQYADLSDKWAVQWAKVDFASAYFIQVNVATKYCVGGTSDVSISPFGIYGDENIFKIQLSDKDGSFANPTQIGASKTSPVPITIPANTPLGNKYRFRAISTQPEIIGNDNGSNVILTGANTHATNVGFENNNIFEMGIFWANGNGEKRIILVKEGNPFTNGDLPMNGKNYIADTQFGVATPIGDAYPVYVGSSAISVRVTGLKGNKTYYVAIIEFSCDPPVYFLEGLTFKSNVVTDLETQLMRNIKVHPNPTSSEFVLDFENIQAEMLNLSIIDGLGKEIEQRSISLKDNVKKAKFDLNSLNKGLYMLKIQANQSMIQKKIIVR